MAGQNTTPPGGQAKRRGKRSPIKLAYVDGKLPITKIDAAVGQLETAITLWFHDGDPVSICSLAYASHEIVFRLNEAKGPDARPSLFEMTTVKDEYRQQVKDALRADPNFCKHAGKDPHEVHFLTVKTLPLVMLDAIGLYNSLGFGRRAIFQLFVHWLWISDWQVFQTKPQEVLTAAQIASVAGLGSRQFFDLMLPIFVRNAAGLK